MIQYCSKTEVSSDILNWWQNHLCAGISLVPGKGNKKMNSIKEKRNLGTQNKTKQKWPFSGPTSPTQGLMQKLGLYFFYFFFASFISNLTSWSAWRSGILFNVVFFYTEWQSSKSVAGSEQYHLLLRSVTIFGSLRFCIFGLYNLVLFSLYGDLDVFIVKVYIAQIHMAKILF